MTVSSVDRAAEFYERVLTFTKSSDSAQSDGSHPALEGAAGAGLRRARLSIGRECMELSEPIAGARRPIPEDARSNDCWFQHVAIVVSDMDAAYARLEANHVAHASVAPQTLPAWNRHAANIRAYYFKDPDGHTLEVIWFPPDKGLPQWHSRAGNALFLGIDHTAVVSRDTNASLAFYVTRLGLHISGASENYGPEQERLNNVPGAHLRITSLRAAVDGPGVELLEYLAPRTGRAIPSDESSDDLIYWRTMMFADGLDSPRSMRDPDGHVTEVYPDE